MIVSTPAEQTVEFSVVGFEVEADDCRLPAPMPMDESGNGKFPYRPTPNTEIPDRISFSRDKTGSGRNPGKFGESGIEIG